MTKDKSTTDASNLPSAFTLFKPSKDIVFRNYKVFAFLYVLPIVFMLLSFLASNTKIDNNDPLSHGVNNRFSGLPLNGTSSFNLSVIVIIGIILAVIVQIMTNKAELVGSQNKRIQLDDLWNTLKTMGLRMTGLYIVMGLVIIGGLLLLIIPGLFMIRRYLLAPYVLLDQKCTIFEAMSRSAKLSLINTNAVWGILGVMVLIGLTSIIPYVGAALSAILGLLYTVAAAIRYQQLKKLS